VILSLFTSFYKSYAVPQESSLPTRNWEHIEKASSVKQLCIISGVDCRSWVSVGSRYGIIDIDGETRVLKLFAYA